MKERKILYKKGIHEPFTILSQSAANRIWKGQKPFLEGFLHFCQKIVTSRYMKHGYQMKGRKILHKKVYLHIHYFEQFSGKSHFKISKKPFFALLFKNHIMKLH